MTPNPSTSAIARRLPWLLGLAIVLWLPGQATAQAPRFWLVAGVYPLLLLWPSGQNDTDTLPRALLPWVFLGLVALLVAPFVVSPGAAVRQSLVLWILVGGAYAGYNAVRAGLTARTIGAACALAAPVVALASLTAWWPQTGTFGNPDLLANVLVLTSVWTLATVFAGPHLAQRAGGLLSLAVQVGVIVGLDSLGAFVALGFAVLVGLGLACLRVKRWGLLAAVVAVGLMLGTWLSSVQTIQEHADTRLYMAQISTALVADAPVTGHGAGQLPRVWLEAQAEFFADAAHRDLRFYWTRADHTHNEVLHAAVEFGVGGGLLLLLPVLLIGLAVVRASSWDDPTTTIAAISAVAGGMVLSTVSLPFHEPACGFLFSMSVGVGLASGATEGMAPGRWRWPALALFAVLLVVSSANFVGDRLLVRGVSDAAEATLDLAATLSLRPARALGHRAAMLESTDADAAWLAATRAAHHEPSPGALVRVGRVAMARDDHPAAIEAFEASVRTHPWFFTGYYNLAVVWDAAGDDIMARRYATRARSLRPWDDRLRDLPR